jgi:hypothetical protein
MDKLVNPHNPCALLIMSLASATSYFYKSIILATPPISNGLTMCDELTLCDFV